MKISTAAFKTILHKSFPWSVLIWILRLELVPDDKYNTIQLFHFKKD